MLALRVQNLAKQYRLGLTHAGSIREVVNRTAGRLLRRRVASAGDEGLGRPNGAEARFWALKDVSVEIARGEVVGIIGRNGAGKSTLLKILSRITAPTRGRVELFGRVASLLEVGTGFHPELTGRENIYLNGAILGMTKAEIRRKFDEIVAFAEVERFVDTPVKRYSSGMSVRLAFAVAAHLDAEILMVDEVLAVGDAKFQAKCLGKMHDVAGSGRTILFVSHIMGTVQNLCTRCLYLCNGTIALDAPADAAVAAYLYDFRPAAALPLTERTDREGSGAVRFDKLTLLGGDDGAGADPIATGRPLRIVLDVGSDAAHSGRSVQLSIGLTDRNGVRLTTFDTNLVQAAVDLSPPSTQVVCRIQELPLVPGEYGVALWAAIDGKTADTIDNAGRFTVHECDIYGTGRIPEAARHGAWTLPHEFYRVTAPSPVE